MNINDELNINNVGNDNLDSDSDDDVINQLKDKLDKKKKALNINNTIQDLEKDVNIVNYKVENVDNIKNKFLSGKGVSSTDDTNQNSKTSTILTDEEKDNLFKKENLDNSFVLQYIQDHVNEGHFETGEIHKASDIEAERLKFEQEENERIQREQEEDNNALIDPEHELMKPVQELLFKQLTSRNQKLQLDLLEKKETLRKKMQQREDVGVELYNIQQQLANAQVSLETIRDNESAIRKYRADAEQLLTELNNKYNEENEKMKKFSDAVEVHKTELEKINQTIKQVDLYHEELKSQISVVKRTTLKTEEDIVKQEIEKKRQDFYIDKLTTQLQKLKEKLALYDSQYHAQSKESKAAHETLHEAEMEMEAMTFEKRQLLNQWNSSVFALQKREDIIKKLNEDIRTLKSEILTKEGVINGFKHSLNQVQERNESLTGLSNRLESEIAFTKKQLSNVRENIDKNKETFLLYSKSLSNTEMELEKASQDQKLLEIEDMNFQKQITQMKFSTKKIEEEIMSLLQDQLYLKKGAHGAERDRSNLKIKINEKEDVIAKTENEIAKLELQSLNLDGILDRLREKSKDIQNEMEIKKKMIDKYELEIKRQNTVIEKRQSEIDALNKKFDELKNVNDEEYVGPMEATINNLMKAVSQKEKEYYEMQQLWIRSQTDLINLSKKNSKMSEEIQDLKMRSSILDRKRIVINTKIDNEEKEIKEHDRNIKQLQHDMVKINTLISKNVDVQSKLIENNLDLENEFKARLKESSINLLRLEEKLESLKNEKEKALNGLIESERQMMLWEKKIQLTKETQAALDPNIGSTEIRDMKLEIHRMKLRLKGLLRLQEKMIVEMEKAVYRREYIQMKGYSKPNTMNNVQTQHNKAIIDLQKKIKIISSDLRECDKEISTLSNTQHQLDEQSSSIKETCDFLEKRQTNLLQEYEKKYNKKNNLINAKLILQKRSKFYTEIKNGTFVTNPLSLNDKKAEFKKLCEKIRKINNVVDTVEKEYGDKYNQFLIESRGLIQLLYKTVPIPKE
ncbi:hypothetical protein BCR36DRAFT_583539 [Piromyces finnis]|uniref:Coiled-coil domain-containing protein 40 n=1 Tax=Piromyces finnis TaxID=1754191 RepID=A0A1Y1V9I9_9FUNG|nr:hypothetical protein BCR36DRAFT_583539 [Piromyces finnis]|eukprot:ORX50411.1 hypothetical protein BCR36DRAFT_583539 [Piromyces finnis]